MKQATKPIHSNLLQLHQPPLVARHNPVEEIFRSLEIAVIDLYPNGMIKHANSVAEAWLADTSKSIQGQFISEILQNLDISPPKPLSLDSQNLDSAFAELLPIDSQMEELRLIKNHAEYVIIQTKTTEERHVKLSVLPNQIQETNVCCQKQPINNTICKHNHREGLTLILQDTNAINGEFKDTLWEANHDYLTGLLNRRAFENELAIAWNRLREDHQTHILFFLDLDRFKLINDTCGHAAGDHVLQIIASLFQVQLDKSACLARIGGDEFGILLQNTALHEGIRIAECLRKSIDEYRFHFDNQTFQIGVSIGITPFKKGTGTVDEVLSMADSACYKAKNNGRNHVHVYQENSLEVSVQREEQKCLLKIQNSLENNQFQLFYQSIIPCRKPKLSQVMYAEVLLRMIDNDNQIIPPEAFIPTAERNEYMHELDLWVVKSICHLLTKNPLETIPLIDRWFVNLSGMSIGYEPLLQYLSQQFQQFPMLAKYLCFEITETAVIKDVPKAINFIRVLKAFGCEFALDDFVGGISPFNYIQLLPVDYVKIDGSLISRMGSDPLSSCIVEFITKIAHLMNIKVIAEGIETTEVMDKVRSGFNIDYMQGYNIMMPEHLTLFGNGI